jgi:outer membrane protein TolC
MDSGMATDNRNESRLLDLNVQRTQLQTKIAKASYLPIVAVGGNFGVSRFLTKTNTRGMAYAVLAMPLSTFWSERHMVKRSKIEEQKALDERKDKRELLDLQVRDAYDNLSAAYEQVEIAKKSVGRAEENLRIKHEEYINGVCNMTTLLDAQRQKSTANDALTDATCDYHHAKTKYLIMTGRKELTY